MRVPLLAVAAIAIGVGAATAVFSAVDPLLFRPLPYPRGDRLVSVGFLGPVDNNEFHRTAISNGATSKRRFKRLLP